VSNVISLIGNLILKVVIIVYQNFIFVYVNEFKAREYNSKGEFRWQEKRFVWQ
jgi:predicted membrane protein